MSNVEDDLKKEYPKIWEKGFALGFKNYHAGKSFNSYKNCSQIRAYERLSFEKAAFTLGFMEAYFTEQENNIKEK